LVVILFFSNSKIHMTNRAFIRSRPFDIHRWSGYPELTNCLEELAAQIEGTETRKRRSAKGSFDWKQRHATGWKITTEHCDG
jgi:hypothetical protein